MAASSSSRLDWLLFLALGGIWGSSYLFIKIAVDAGLPPLVLVMGRLVLGFGLLAAVVLVRREPLPRDPRVYGRLFLLAIVSVALPFTLIASAEQHVDSALAATMAGAIPLLVVPLAALAYRSERLTASKLTGVAIGLVGVLVLVGFDPAAIGGRDPLAQLALLASTVSYAVGTVYARRASDGVRPLVSAMVEVGFAMAIVTALAFAFERPADIVAFVRPEAILAVTWLGLLGSGTAYLLFFALIGHWGAGRTSMVAYVLPAVGIVLGVLVLGERADGRLVAGGALILAGIVLVNLSPRLRLGSRGWGNEVAVPAPPVAVPAPPVAAPAVGLSGKAWRTR